jgi:hypothetical protein
MRSSFSCTGWFNTRRQCAAMQASITATESPQWVAQSARLSARPAPPRGPSASDWPHHADPTRRRDVGRLARVATRFVWLRGFRAAGFALVILSTAHVADVELLLEQRGHAHGKRP